MKKALLVIGTLLVAFPAFGAYVGSAPEGKERSHQRDVIALCWQEQERKSLSPEAAKFVAGACEKLESDFRENWHRDP